MENDTEQNISPTWSLLSEASIESLQQVNNSSTCLMNKSPCTRDNCCFSSHSRISQGNNICDCNLMNISEDLPISMIKDFEESRIYPVNRISSLQPSRETDFTELLNKNNIDTIETKVEKMSKDSHYLGLHPDFSKSNYNCINHENLLSIDDVNLKNFLPTYICDGTNQISKPFDFFKSISSFESSLDNTSKTASNIYNYNRNFPISTVIDSKSYITYSEFEMKSYNSIHSKSNIKQISSNNIKTSHNKKRQLLSNEICKKIYFCAACETYFENWNLFLHMRIVHGRYICLFCLGMFGQVERLSCHLRKKHLIAEIDFLSDEDFLKIFQNSCYIVCCSCEKIFTASKSFSDHHCIKQLITSETFLVGKKKDPCEKISGIISKKKEGLRSLESSIVNLELSTRDAVLSNKILKGIRRHSQRIIKPSKLLDDVYLYSKFSNINARKTKNNVTEESNLRKSNSIAMKDNSCRIKQKNSVDRFSQNVVVKSLITENTNVKDKLNSDKKKEIVNMSAENMLKNKDAIETNASNHFFKINDFNDVHNIENDKNKYSENPSFNSPDYETIDLDSTGENFFSSVIHKSTLTKKAVTNRSLVIKICTKKKSMFSISNPSTFNYDKIENDRNSNNSAESEENNDINVSHELVSSQNVCETVIKSNDPSKINESNVFNDLENKNIINNEIIESDRKKYISLNSENNLKKKEIHFLNLSDLREINQLNNEVENTKDILVASEKISLVNLDVDDLIDCMSIEDLLMRCIQAVCTFCVYCNHARQIAVNGKQLGLHMLAEHRFQPQHPAIIMHHEQIVAKIMKNLKNLEPHYLNLDSYNSIDSKFSTSTVKLYECFHCRFSSTVFKELYIHNKKMHQKPTLLCIMCKSTFYSYSELLCHLCPGIYAANTVIQYRCCLCSVNNLPSAFRLMVHLRKQHHACDVCLESTENQQRLSNHVWKHKLHHFCYRCGITYRNKPDITKHLFWKHGTESILCKKCLQKKWPHIYHFCIPPATFTCDECGLGFSKAVSLKVHKRIHTNDFIYSCPECSEKFISKKLLSKHDKYHKELSHNSSSNVALSNYNNHPLAGDLIHIDVCNIDTKENISDPVCSALKSEEINKKIVDVYDLPPLNLSSDSDSEVEDGKIIRTKVNEKSNGVRDLMSKNKQKFSINNSSPHQLVTSDCVRHDVVEIERDEEEKKHEKQIMDGIWDNFRIYTENLDKSENCQILIKNEISSAESKVKNIYLKENLAHFQNAVFADHDYCVTYLDKLQNQSSIQTVEDNDSNSCKRNIDLKKEKINLNDHQVKAYSLTKKKVKYKKKKKNSCSSSSECTTTDSDSSECSCKTNCSCSSSSSTITSSSGSSGSNSSESANSLKILKSYKKDNKIGIQEDKVMIEEKILNYDENVRNDNIKMKSNQIFSESDLYTTESETDEDFYDKCPNQIKNNSVIKRHDQLVFSESSDSSNIIVSPMMVNGTADTNSLKYSFITPSIPNDTLKLTKITNKVEIKNHGKSIINSINNFSENLKLDEITIPQKVNKKNSSSEKKDFFKSNLIFDQPLFEMKPKILSNSTMEIIPSIKEGNSETEMKRFSKRKRVPKRFYEDSSEGNYKHQIVKYRKIDFQPFRELNLKYQNKDEYSILQQQEWQKLRVKNNDSIDKRTTVIGTKKKAKESADDTYTPKDSNCKSFFKSKNTNSASIHFTLPNLERLKKLYCYCQCPYDEVSEMIACDGDNCQIEWFHFECVGIVMPPKGKWYCPDCKKIPSSIDS